MILVATLDGSLRTVIARSIARHGMIALIAGDGETAAAAASTYSRRIVGAVLDDQLLPHGSEALVADLHAAAGYPPIFLLSDEPAIALGESSIITKIARSDAPALLPEMLGDLIQAAWLN
jgi:DNA-binding response OmpR family regulator